MALTKAGILGKNDLPIEEVFIPEWEDSVFVRTLMVKELDLYQLQAQESKAKPEEFDMRASLAVLVLVDEKGKRLFEPHDVPLLAKKSAAALDRVYDVASRLNHIGQGAVEDAKKNSPPTPSEDSSSG